MSRLIVVVAIVAALVVSGTPAAADGECRQEAHETFVAASDEGTMGDFMSDVIFGNEPNMANAAGGPSEQEPGSQAGDVLASWSPGPWVNTGEENQPPRNDRVRGFGGGDLQASVRAACN